ncbi:MAG TPA: hypothetical protein VJZ71_15240 [Phycisphaerae bacterium]|nr:hypothetical protein [Phycisphaerae bacterium]
MHEVAVAEVVAAEGVAAAAADAACLAAAAARLRSADPAAAVRVLPLDRPLGLHNALRTAADHLLSAVPAGAAEAADHLRTAGPAAVAAADHLRTADPAVAAAPDHPNGPRTARVAVVATTVQVVRVV